MTDNERIKKLEAQIETLERKQVELANELAEARLDQWKGRLEDLEVQAHLGAMDTNDRVVALVQQARDRWNDARGQFGDATSAAGDVVERLRGGIEGALNDLRRALLDARKQVAK